jgi:hypothetical protein
MKKLGVIGIVIVLALTAIVAGTAGAKSTPEASPDAPMSLNMIFDGYCDGISGTLDPVASVFVGTYTSTCSTCPGTDRLSGNFGKVFIPPAQYTITMAWETLYGGGPYLWTAIRYQPRTWTHYNFDGTVFASGTWSPCPPPGEVVPGTRPSTAR